MNRAIVLLALLLSVVVFADKSGAGGLDPVSGRMVRAGGAVVLIDCRQDRGQMAATCSACCSPSAALVLTKTTSLPATSASGPDLHGLSATRTAFERLYRPPKPDGQTFIFL